MFLEDHETRRVIDKINGRVPEDAVLKDMKAFFKERYDVDIYDYICDRAKTGLLRVRFIFWSSADIKRVKHDGSGKYSSKINDRFSSSCKEHGLNEEYFDPSGYFVVMTEFKSDAEHLIMTENMMRKISALLGGFPEVKSHRFSPPTVFVFYEKDSDIESNWSNGLSVKISDAVSGLLGSVEGFEGRELGDVRFSSLETFEGKYKGKFYNFWLDN